MSVYQPCVREMMRTWRIEAAQPVPLMSDGAFYVCVIFLQRDSEIKQHFSFFFVPSPPSFSEFARLGIYFSTFEYISFSVFAIGVIL